ncbi:MAG TPA: diacylglycerol kinase family protein [Actinomycetota bacterium]|jgi:diacylglycerol kinase (ATP)|nr:diacylglycerol kinase family protein [Actinomycetota bacterium]
MGPVVLVANPTAGGGRGRRMIPRAEAALGALGIEHRLVMTDDGAHPLRAARRAATEGIPAVVALGGDGLVGSCAEGLVGSGTVLAVVPSGNGNDFARSLGLHPKRPFLALECLREGRVRPVDAVRAEGPAWERHYVCVGGAGFDSEVNAYANTLTRLHGAARYVVAVFRTLTRFHPSEFTIRVDGDECRLPAMMVAVANAPQYGGGMRVCPEARLDDGLVDVCVVRAIPRRTFVALFPKVFTGRHVTLPVVIMLRGQKVEIEAARPFDVYGDGERLGPLPATFTAVAGALKVAAP